MILKQNGGVVLMHDVKPITAKIIAEVLDDLEAENCQRLADEEGPDRRRCRSTTSCTTARRARAMPADVAEANRCVQARATGALREPPACTRPT